MFSYYKKSFTEGARAERSWLNSVFTKKGAKKADSALSKVIGPGRKTMSATKGSLFLWGGAIGLGVPRRLRQGDSLPAAIGKEAVRDAAYIAMPYLLPLTAAKGLTKMYPEMKAMSEAEREAAVNYKTVGGGYQSTEADHASRARGMEMIQRHTMAPLGSEARKFHRTP